MVDPASGSIRSQQQQPQPVPSSQATQAPALSITVTALTQTIVDQSVIDNHHTILADADDGVGTAGATMSIGPLSQETIESAAQSLLDDLVDDVILGVVFEVHRGIKLGLTTLLEEGPPGEL
jgi:hypothetical protein